MQGKGRPARAGGRSETRSSGLGPWAVVRGRPGPLCCPAQRGPPPAGPVSERVCSWGLESQLPVITLRKLWKAPRVQAGTWEVPGPSSGAPLDAAVLGRARLGSHLQWLLQLIRSQSPRC